MKTKRLLALMTVICIIALIFLPVVVNAAGEDKAGTGASSLITEIKDQKADEKSGLGSFSTKVKTYGGQVIDVIRYVVMVILVIFSVMAIGEFRNTGEPQKKLMLKARIAGLVVGFIILFNVWSILDLISKIQV